MTCTMHSPRQIVKNCNFSDKSQSTYWKKQEAGKAGKYIFLQMIAFIQMQISDPR